MDIQVSLFRKCDVDTVFMIQQAAFKPLYEKYHDDSSNPYMETEKTVYQKYTREGTVGYIFTLNGTAVGAVRINTDHAKKSGRVSALCVLPEYQGKGIAQKALLEIEKLHPDIERWFLDTIKEEAGNCHLYEKIGYKKTGKSEAVNEKMTLVFYEKNRQIDSHHLQILEKQG
jgi:GNAT superfamily N-acetyltransferase